MPEPSPTVKLIHRQSHAPAVSGTVGFLPSIGHSGSIAGVAVFPFVTRGPADSLRWGQLDYERCSDSLSLNLTPPNYNYWHHAHSARTPGASGASAFGNKSTGAMEMEDGWTGRIWRWMGKCI